MPNPVMAINETLLVPVAPPQERFGTVGASATHFGATMTVTGAYAIDTGFDQGSVTPSDADANAFVAANRDADGNSIYLDSLARHVVLVVGPIFGQTFTYYGYTTAGTNLHIAFGAAAQTALRAALLAAGHNLTLVVKAGIGYYPVGNGLNVARELATVNVDITLPSSGAVPPPDGWTDGTPGGLPPATDTSPGLPPATGIVRPCAGGWTDTTHVC